MFQPAIELGASGVSVPLMAVAGPLPSALYGVTFTLTATPFADAIFAVVAVVSSLRTPPTYTR